MKLWQQQSQFAQDIAILIKHIHDQGYYCTFSDAYRSPEMAALYAKEGKGIPNSQHCKRLAVDLNLFDRDGNFLQTDNNAYEKFGCFWESLDAYNRWGGHFERRDENHYERKDMV